MARSKRISPFKFGYQRFKKVVDYVCVLYMLLVKAADGSEYRIYLKLPPKGKV